jgi:hypothetical protein
MVSRFEKKVNRSMTEDQFCQVVDAILNGKYSWACVLILKFAGYNPLHYIPYRTYNRLMKENSFHKRGNEKQIPTLEKSIEVHNLPHLHIAEKEADCTRGGNGWRSIWEHSHIYGVLQR